MKRDYQFECLECGVTKTYNLEESDVKRWQDGELIQNVFPEIKDREIMISGTCGDCFEKMFTEWA